MVGRFVAHVARQVLLFEPTDPVLEARGPRYGPRTGERGLVAQVGEERAVGSVGLGDERRRDVTDVGGIGAKRLRSFIERIERLEDEKAALSADIREVYGEAKADGFDAKIMRQIVRLRKMDKADRQEQEELLELYKSALGLSD